LLQWQILAQNSGAGVRSRLQGQQGLRIGIQVLHFFDHELGPGVAAADLPRLFERFYRGEAAKPRSSGTGMGLSIARGLLASVGGRIWADNHPEGGAIFTIVVPAGTRGAPADEEIPA
jgi:signal transduction histidine kinase